MAFQWDFDFGLMARLAREAPEEFARRREALILQAISEFRCPERGFRLQAEIDAERMRSAPGEQACLALLVRMSESLQQLSALMSEVRSLAAEAGQPGRN